MCDVGPIKVFDQISDDVNKLKKVSDGSKVYVDINDVFDIIDKYKAEAESEFECDSKEKLLKLIIEMHEDDYDMMKIGYVPPTFNIFSVIRNGIPIHQKGGKE